MSARMSTPRSGAVEAGSYARRRVAPVDVTGRCPGGHRRSGGGRLPVAVLERVLELLARGDAELGEHLAQMPFDRARAEEELRPDLRVRAPTLCKPGDVLLLWRELVTGVVAAPAHLLPRGQELVSGALREPVQPHRAQHVVGLA